MTEVEDEVCAFFRRSPTVDYWGARIDEAHVRRYFASSARRFRLVSERAIALRPRRAAEIGPAYGAIALEMARAGIEVTTYEMPEGVAAYTSVLQSRGIPVIPWDMHLADMTEAFDLVIASEVLEHLQMGLATATRKLARLLAPGGHLLVTVPNAYNLANIVRIVRGRNIQEEFGEVAAVKNGVVVDARVHPREPVPREMVEAMRAAGLTVSRVAYFNTLPRSRRAELAYAMAPAFLRDHVLIEARRG